MSTASKQALSKHRKARHQRKRQSWLPFALMAFGGLVITAVIALAFTPQNGQSIQPPRAGTPMSDFSRPDLSGQQVRLSDYQGQVVLVNTWATWCPPCRAEMPALNAYYQKHAADGFVILAINAGETSTEAAAFARDFGLAFPVLLDPQTELMSQLNIHSYPTSIVIDRDGVVKEVHIGMLTPEQVEAKIGPLLTP